jgi:enoyl-CoA hydratase/carnithine racemase
MTVTQPTVRYEVREAIAVLTIDRPQVKNALGPDEWAQLAAHVARAQADADVRALLLEGAGGTFSAGGDLRTMPERLNLPYDERRARLYADAQLVRALREGAKPSVAKIAGVAVGAGLSLALACDVRIAATNARLGATFHKVGLTGDFGMLWLLPRTVGPARAADLLFAAELVDGVRAEMIGLVSRAVAPERLDDEAWNYCRKLAAGPPIAMAKTKAGLERALDIELDAMLAWEADAQATCSKTADAREGVAAFIEKRVPRFTGR